MRRGIKIISKYAPMPVATTDYIMATYIITVYAYANNKAFWRTPPAGVRHALRHHQYLLSPLISRSIVDIRYARRDICMIFLK